MESGSFPMTLLVNFSTTPVVVAPKKPETLSMRTSCVFAFL
jgi:hypothetical protein